MRGQTGPLLGISYEYLPHVCLYSTVSPQLVNQYVNLTNYSTVFSTLHGNHNNIVRLIAIFNSSPGFHDQNNTGPFPHEAPFVWNGTRWDPTQPIDPTWLNDLEAVVCSAYGNDLVVQVTLFDPWNPSWTYSPFNPAMTANSSGFTGQQYFASFDAVTTDMQAANKTARTNQEAALTAVVNRLKKYPNVIWQIANEPDFNTVGGLGVIPDVVVWEQAMAGIVRTLDPTHVIMVNGHYTGASTCGTACASFSWSVAEGAYPTIESAHYTTVNKTSFVGAIALLRDTSAGVAGNIAGVAIGFDENQPVSSTNFPWRTVKDMRAEAWEFLMYTGGLFNAYTLDKTNQNSISASTQLGTLYNILNTTSIGGISVAVNFNAMRQVTCGTGEWCIGIGAWGQGETNANEIGCLPQQAANIYWSTMSDFATSQPDASVLYIHHGVPMSQADQTPPGPPINDGYYEVPCFTKAGSGYQTSLTVTLPKSNCYNVQWVEPDSGVVLSSQWYSSPFDDGGVIPLTSPLYSDDVVLLVRRQLSGLCGL